MAIPYSEGDTVATRSDPKHTRLFNIGDELECCDGSIITVHSVIGETFLGSDGVTRYDREHYLEHGRVTGTHSWPPHPKTIASGHPLTYPKEVVAALANCPSFGHQIVSRAGKREYDSAAMMKQICENLDAMFHMKKTGEVL